MCLKDYMSNSFRNIQEHYFVITLNSDSLNSVVNVSLNDGWRLWRTVLVVNSFNIKWVFFRRDRLVSFTKLNLTNGSLVLEYSLGGKSSALWKTKKVFLARNHYFNEFWVLKNNYVLSYFYWKEYKIINCACLLSPCSSNFYFM